MYKIHCYRYCGKMSYTWYGCVGRNVNRKAKGQFIKTFNTLDEIIADAMRFHNYWYVSFKDDLPKKDYYILCKKWESCFSKIRENQMKLINYSNGV